MGVLAWITTHWLDLLQSIGIVSGFVFTAHSIRKEAEARRISNLISMAEHHHAIWKQVYDRPGLARILDANAALDTKPLTQEEHRFIISIIIHLDGVHRAIKAKMFVRLQELRRDVKEFFALPIPKAAWEKLRPLQDADFVAFIEDCIAGDK